MHSVTVVMSTYDDEKYLSETIESVLDQEFGDFELVIVNDGSPDPQTRETLSYFQKQDARIQVIHKNNEGLTKALIDGCSTSNGTYIARIDVGDVFTADRIGKQKKILDEYPDCAFVSCHTEFFGPKWELLWINSGRPPSDVPVSVIPENTSNGLTGDIPHHGSVMFRKSSYESVGGYRKQFYYGQDWDLWYRLAEIGNYFIVPEVLYKVRIFPECISMTSKHYQDTAAQCSLGAFMARRCNEDEQPWIEMATSICPENMVLKTKNDHNFNKEPGLYFIGEALRRNGDHRCRPYFRNAIRQSPLRARAYIRWLQSMIQSNQTYSEASEI